jgi:hypothetical protein
MIGPALSNATAAAYAAQRMLIVTALHLETAEHEVEELPDIIELVGALANALQATTDELGHAEVARRFQKQGAAA